MELAFVLILAVFTGMAAGLLPGIGASMVIVSMYPMLMKYDVTTIFFFYIALITTMQYYSSISSIIFGVMGEPTSQPAVNNGHVLFLRGLGDKILGATSTSSFVASLIGVLIFCICASHSALLVSMLSLIFKVSVLVLVLALLLFTSENPLVGTILMILGLTLGMAGSDIIPAIYYIFPKYSVFDGGIPFAPLLTGFIVVPTLLLYSIKTTNQQVADTTCLQISIRTRIKNLFDFSYFCSTLRGSIIGCIAGIVPGVSYTISSNLAESVEKFLNNKGTSDQSLTQNILSAEAANNSGSIIVLIPLLLFAIPIVPSESLILSLAESRGFDYLSGLSFVSDYFIAITLLLIGVNAVNWIVSGYYYKLVVNLYQFLGKHGYIIALLVCLTIVLINGFNDNQFLYTVYVLLASTFFGLLIKDVGTKMMFVFSFFIAGNLVPDLYRLYLTYL